MPIQAGSKILASEVNNKSSTSFKTGSIMYASDVANLYTGSEKIVKGMLIKAIHGNNLKTPTYCREVTLHYEGENLYYYTEGWAYGNNYFIVRDSSQEKVDNHYTTNIICDSKGNLSVRAGAISEYSNEEEGDFYETTGAIYQGADGHWYMAYGADNFGPVKIK